MSKPRYTAEEWEELQQAKWAETKRAARERGDLVCTVLLDGRDVKRLPKEHLIELLDLKLAAAKRSLLRLLEEPDEDDRL